MARSPHLAKLECLVGTWDLRVRTVDGQTLSSARARVEWTEGGAYLALRQEGDLPPDAPAEWRENSPLPALCLIGVDDASGEFAYLYSDARDVFRVYRMTLDDTTWRVWRAAPEFHQRYIGTLAADGQTITGAWEFSKDGETWTHDFALDYHRTGGPA
ncbi:hypothetical protein ACIBG7_20085 [Nonomuraea sp. NPDC050328]|uniref:hypothetical protein n=1 Tax=Nonomuraea sp. NPDC050328 TaxID=3364361 RepID=UPI0037A02F32